MTLDHDDWAPLCPVCGEMVQITGQTADGRLIGSCGDAFSKAAWAAMPNGEQPEPDTCGECGEIAAGYTEGTPYCAAHYRSRP